MVTSVASPRRLFVAATSASAAPLPGMTDGVWEPTDDPAWWRMVAPCDDGCHHPVHAFGSPERRRHLEAADWIIRNGVEVAP